ncbi:uncharacterized protein LOC135685226 [Rhopilema esculentum]|uniref:uncharacterized protein LOC135685226 n=1 Tax=Rhopilema esculentum TaxID=499914 RepID=UPI0031D6EA90|eukprot:gene2945-1192_t
MEEKPNRKQSKFLSDLDEYYKAREKHTYSFGNVPCPQNFIPGTTKAKTNVKLLRSLSRKVSSVCYRGVVIQMKETMTAVEKGLIPAGLLALGVPTPSQHTSCLEHKIEQFWHRQSKLFDSLPRIGDGLPAKVEDISEEEDKYLLSVASSKPRGCSMPTTSRDIGSLPVLSYDDNFVAVLGKLGRAERRRRMSYPLNRAEYENYKPQLRKFRSLQQKPVDSVIRLSVLCRGVSYHGSNSERLYPLKKHGESASEVKESTKSVKSNRKVLSNLSSPMTKERSLESDAVQYPWQRESWTSSDNDNRDTESNNDTSKQPHRSASLDATGTSLLERREKELHSPKKRSFKDRFTFRRKKASEYEDVNETAPDKETLSHIQRVLRSKLPKTLQTTVKMGLSFDPITSKERNYKARECPTLTSMLTGRIRSKSTPGSPLIATRKSRSRTMGETLPGPSLIISPPSLDEISNTRDEKISLLENFIKLGKSTLRRSDRNKKAPEQKRPSLPGIEVTEPLSDEHAKKLENILGPEFRAAYASQRSNSMPLIRRKKTALAKKLPIYARSTSELGKQERSTGEMPALDMWSSYDTSDSDFSHPGRSRGISFESEISDQEKQFENGSHDTSFNNDVEKEQKIVTTPQILVFLSPQSTNNKGAAQVISNTSSQKPSNEVPISSCPRTPDMTLDQSNIERGHAFVEKQAIKETNGTFQNGMNSKRSNEKFSLKIETRYISVKGSRLLKSSQELLADSKASHVDHSMSGKKTKKMESVNNKDIGSDDIDSKHAEVKPNEKEVELEKLDILLKELESFAVD